MREINRPKTITKEQAHDLNYWIEGRFKLIFALAVESGLRISDILSLKVRDIRQNPTMIYEKKSKRKRKITMSTEVWRDLGYMTGFKTEDDFVFDSERKRGVSVHRSTFHRQIKKALKWLDFDASAHSARKLYAQSIYEATGSVESVQRALNHRKISTTYTYLDLAQQNAPESEESATEHTENIFSRIINAIKKILKRS